jgi:hypothetical protein
MLRIQGGFMEKMSFFSSGKVVNVHPEGVGLPSKE